MAETPEQPQKRKYTAKNFDCTRCGAPITVKYPGASLSVSCPNCKVVIDITDQNYRILAKYFDKTKEFDPIIPLGTRGKLFGKEWEVIGFVVRRDKLSGFAWEEYLLFNPYYGYRWLTRNNGHWSFVTMIKDKPYSSQAALSRVFVNRVDFQDNNYKLFYSGHAVVAYVFGEFYWKVKTDSEVWMSDYVCPPYMLSNEWDNRELVWSKSEYLDINTVKDAFKIIGMAGPEGVAPNQPSPYLKTWSIMRWLWIFFIVLLIGLSTALNTKAMNYTALRQMYNFTMNGKTNDTTTPVFELLKDKANVELTFRADVDNSWFYISGEMVNDETGDTYYFERTCEYYHGFDGGESWSEGSNTQNILLSGVPGGKYYINFDTESGDFHALGDRNFTLQVQRDVPTPANFMWSFFWLCILPVISWLNMRHFEVSRWSESDYSPYVSSSS